MTPLARRITEVRKDAGLNKKEFAARIGLSPPAVTYLEQGVTTPSESTLKVIETEFGVYRAWLKTGRGEKYKEDADLISIVKELNKEQKVALRAFLETIT